MPAPARFFVALLPPQSVQAEITAIKQDIWQRFGSRAALSAPPHITLQPPFQWPLEQVSDLEQSLAALAQRQIPLPIALDGYSAFAPRVIYIDVVQTPGLMALQPQLMAHLETHCGICDPIAQTRAFVPHVTVGFRDLTPEAFHRAWAELAQRPFAAEFIAPKLTLLHYSAPQGQPEDERHRGQKWQIFAEFSLNASIL
ncbi:MAG: 2'-5' RNA ligase family protein [Leptolyngbya sp. DLM2.Bin27]|nr:MAG: 2'-5' RNA ligase family protein [Leptolyngbya sp. DLM2.Bin27]